MGKFSFDMTLGELLEVKEVKDIIQKAAPDLLSNPMLGMAKGISANNVKGILSNFVDDETWNKIKNQVEKL